MRALLVLTFVLFSTYNGAFAQCNNVVTNGDATGGLTGWNFSSGSGATWTIQNNTYGNAFVASYNWTTMNQTIDLWNSGYTAAYLDNLQPEISYMQMFRGHASNYSDKYYFTVELKNSSNQTIASYNLGSQGSPITTTSAWDTVSGSFTNYGSGARYVRIECGGDDVEYWAGNYGTVVDNTIVSVEEIQNVNICSGTYTWNGNTYGTSGQYGGSFTGQFGCDSNVILNLQIGPYNIADTFELCDGDSFYFDGQYYHEDDTLAGNFTSVAGCDSNVNYLVNFRDSYDDTIYAFICPGEGYDFGGTMLFTPGSYSDAFTSQYGCDSLISLELDYAPTPFLQLTDYFCAGENYTFGDTTLTAAGFYTRAFESSFGCDSTVQLTLIQDQSHDITLPITLCEGDFIEFGSSTITEEGTYNENFTTAGGACDSAVTLEVTVTDINTGVTKGEGSLTSKDNASGSSYRWLNCNQDMLAIAGAASQTFFPILGGTYAVEVTNGNCVDTSNCIVFFPVGMDFPANADINVYPNPSTDRLTLQNNGSEMVKVIHMNNMIGQVVFTKRFSSNEGQVSIDVSDLARGAYVLQVETRERKLSMVISLE